MTSIGISTVGALVLGVCCSYWLVTRGSGAVTWGVVLAVLLVVISPRVAPLGLVVLRGNAASSTKSHDGAPRDSALV